jgi:hypothetical protein
VAFTRYQYSGQGSTVRLVPHLDAFLPVTATRSKLFGPSSSPSPLAPETSARAKPARYRPSSSKGGQSKMPSSLARLRTNSRSLAATSSVTAARPGRTSGLMRAGSASAQRSGSSRTSNGWPDGVSAA